MSFYKKTIFTTITILVALIFIIKFALSSLENKIFEISKSERFHNFIIQRLKYELNRHSSKKFTKDEINFYTKEINQTLIKWKPIFDDLDIKSNK